jgi:hypothetical protein
MYSLEYIDIPHITYVIIVLYIIPARRQSKGIVASCVFLALTYSKVIVAP